MAAYIGSSAHCAARGRPSLNRTEAANSPAPNRPDERPSARLRAPHRSVGYVDAVSCLTATIYDCTLYLAERTCLADWRSEVIGPLHGDVLELGAGTGLNLDHYSPHVTSVTLVEPDPAMRHRLERRVSRSAASKRTRVCKEPSESLSFESECFDAVVGTLVLCSVDSVERTLAQARRVLRPGGTLALIEHVVAPERTVRRRWQNSLEPVWSVVSGGCHLLRDPRSAIAKEGFEPLEVSNREMTGVPGFIRSAILGTWRRT